MWIIPLQVEVQVVFVKHFQCCLHTMFLRNHDVQIWIWMDSSSSCVYSQCAMHIVVGPCAKGHFIHAGASSGPEVLLLILNGLQMERVYIFNAKIWSVHCRYCRREVAFLELGWCQILQKKCSVINDISHTFKQVRLWTIIHALELSWK
jgi:hypothetical protein